MKINRNIRRLVIIILLPALCWLFFNAVYNRHFHELSSGIIISHSHPYDKTKDCSNPYASHSHSEDEFLLYDIISDTILFVLLGGFLTVLLYELFLKEICYNIAEEIIDTSHPFILKYRGPPYYI